MEDVNKKSEASLRKPAKAYSTAGYELEFHERFAQLLQMVGGPGRAAKLLGRGATTIDNWRTGRSRVPFWDMLILADAAGVTLDWVATGHDRRPNLPPTEGAAVEYVRIEVYGAGDDNALTKLGFQPPAAYWRGWLDEADIAPETCAVVMVQDEGMAPEIGSGDMVLVDRARTAIESGGVYALVRQRAVLVRRVQVMVDGGVRIFPTNTLYKEETLTPEAAASLPVAGRVRAVFRFVD